MPVIEVNGASVFIAGSALADSSRPAVVLLHGAGMNHRVWAWQCRALARDGRRVLAVDLPGHGRSAGPALSRIEAFADWLVSLLDAAALDRAGLAGHSLGALIALDAAARHPGRVRALALVGAALSMPVHPKLLTAADDDPPAAVAMMMRWSRGEEPEATTLSNRPLIDAAPGVLAAGLAACDAFRLGSERSQAVHCPTIVVAGTHDRMTPMEGARALAAAIPAAELAAIQDAGHMLPLTAPRETLAALLRVL